MSRNKMFIYSAVIIALILLGFINRRSAIAAYCPMMSRCVFNDCAYKDAKSPCDNRPDDAICIACDGDLTFPVCSYIADPLVTCQTVGVADDCGDSFSGKCKLVPYPYSKCIDLVHLSSNCNVWLCTSNY